MTPDARATFPRRHALTRRFTLGAPRSFRIAADGNRVAFLRSSDGFDSANNLWIARKGSDVEMLFDAATAGVETELSDAEKARRERAREQAGGVVSYATDDELNHVVFVLGGEIFRVSTADGSAQTMASASPAFDPRPQPGGSAVAYVSGSTLRITDGTTDRLIPGASDDSESVSWGSAEFVAAEEMGRSRGFWWAPDGSAMAACRVDVAGVDTWWISSPEAPSTEPRPIRYPSPGTTNASVELWIVDPDEGPHTKVDWQQGEYEYLADVSWSKQLLITVQTRDQRATTFCAVDPESGAVTELARITDDHWVELIPGSPTWRGDQLLWIADEDGARRLVGADGLRTGDDHNVRSVAGVDDDSVIVTTALTAPTSVVARVAADGSITTLSDVDGTASAVVGGGTMVVSQATADAATSTQIRWNDGTTQVVESFAEEPGFACTPHFAIVGSRQLHAALCLPEGHDGSPLPVLLDPYGGPHAQRVTMVRNGYATSQWFADQGFAVVVIDGRGTPGRGPAFEREVWGDLAQPVLDDQIEAMQALAAERPELDLTRVGIRGWSFGGYLAALAVLRRPDAVHAAIAGAPVTDWMLYDTHYTERYLGHPETYPDHYVRTNLINDAHRLERPLMLIHGLADDNVVAAHTLTFSRALLEAGRPHEVLPLSGVTHMTPQEQVAENLLHLQRDFLLDALASPA
ncbi:MAG: S9 family peptidase [Acidimicrobiales bacterium]|nr:MAG: S9 family peptidase [Acidimicrobiales bacterium]